MRERLLSLVFLSLLLIPVLNILSIAQTSIYITPTPTSSTSKPIYCNYDWAINAYSSSLDGYNYYMVTFANFSYFPINTSNEYVALEIFNLPINATGYYVCPNGDITYFYQIVVQLVVEEYCIYSYANYFIYDAFIIFNSALSEVVVVNCPISVSLQTNTNFSIGIYTVLGKWYAYLFSGNGFYYKFPAFPLYPGEVINNTYINGNKVTMHIENISDISSPIHYYGYWYYPSVSVEIHSASQSTFTDLNPYFVTLFKIEVGYSNGPYEPYNAPYNGQNLISADSAGGNSDNGSMIGACSPPSGVAWGAIEYVASQSWQNTVYYTRITTMYNVSWWILGTEKGINAVANLIHLPVNEPQNGNFINMLTEPQEEVALPYYTYYIYRY